MKEYWTFTGTIEFVSILDLREGLLFCVISTFGVFNESPHSALMAMSAKISTPDRCQRHHRRHSVKILKSNVTTMRIKCT